MAACICINREHVPYAYVPYIFYEEDARPLDLIGLEEFDWSCATHVAAKVVHGPLLARSWICLLIQSSVYVRHGMFGPQGYITLRHCYRTEMNDWYIFLAKYSKKERVESHRWQEEGF